MPRSPRTCAYYRSSNLALSKAMRTNMCERIIISERTAHYESGQGEQLAVPLKNLVAQIRASGVTGLVDEPLPDNVRWSITAGSLQVWIVELPYQLRRLLWIDENSPVKHGPQATYKARRL